MIKEKFKKLKKAKKLCILGTASTLGSTPWDKKEYDYWGCSPVITHEPAQGKRIDVLFELHHMEYWGQEAVSKRLNDSNVPIFMLKETPFIKNSITYPIKEIQEEIKNVYLKKYFTNTIAYMIALAILMGYERIELYGVHMSAKLKDGDDEYERQKPCCEAWLAYGAGKDVEMLIPDESDIFKCPIMYGYDNKDSLYYKVLGRRKGLLKGKTELQQKIRAAEKQLAQQEGAIIDCDHWMKQEG